MAKYIDREALLKDIEESVVFTVNRGKPSLEIRGANAITDRIKSAPAADVEEVKHGRWCWEGKFKACSNCGTHVEWKETLGASFWKFCPYCGCKMDGGKDETK